MLQEYALARHKDVRDQVVSKVAHFKSVGRQVAAALRSIGHQVFHEVDDVAVLEELAGLELGWLRERRVLFGVPFKPHLCVPPSTGEKPNILPRCVLGGSSIGILADRLIP